MADQVDFSAASPSVTDYTNGVRHVRFVAMQHIGSAEYYANAARIVRDAQRAGGIHFYEWMDMYQLGDTDQRKVRKLTQFLPMPDVYGVVAEMIGRQLGMTLQAQQTLDLVGLLNDSDVNADITPAEFLRRVEAELGPLQLSEEDLRTPLTEPISAGLPEERWIHILLDGRNVDLARMVHEAPLPKIVITYGAGHEAGWLMEIQRLDPHWGPRTR